jgi:hypothetical protein
MVAKIPSARHELVRFFQEQGYSFMEAAITLKHDLKNVSVPQRLYRVCEKCTWEIMNENDMRQLSCEIEKNIFKTDRVYLDPQFKKGLAARRYDLWVKDLIAQGNLPYKVCYGDDVVGFFLNKEIKPGVYDGLLAATYSDYEGTGMGYCVQYAGIQWAVQQGAKSYIGHISGNNPAVMRVLLSIGFSIKEMKYIFIKHSKGD